MRTLITAVITALLLSGCSQAETHSKTNVSQAEKVIKAILKPLAVRGVEVKSVTPTKEVEVPGFETFKVDLVDKRNHREIRRYIFINPEKGFIALQIFKYSVEGKNVILKPIKPKNAEKPLKVDVSFLKEVDKKLSEANIPHVIGKSDKKVYIIWDVFCPFCYGHFNQIEKIAKENNVEIHLIPLAVHGEKSLKGIVLYTKLAREKGPAEALKELYRMGNGDFMKYAKALEKRLEGGKEITNDQSKILEAVQQTEAILLKNGVRATPTIIYVPPGENKARIHVGFTPIEQLIKENR